jgi:hypothetical protein
MARVNDNSAVKPAHMHGFSYIQEASPTPKQNLSDYCVEKRCNRHTRYAAAQSQIVAIIKNPPPRRFLRYS